MYNPYTIVVPSKMTELNVRFTRKEDKPVFNPMRR
jgi:hypothetical protein